MKSLTAVLVVVLFTAIAPAQTTQPAPALSPAGQAQPKIGLTKFYVAPFTETGGTMIRAGWLGSRFTDLISKDLSTFSAVQLVKPAATQSAPRPEEGDKAYLDQARQAGAEVAIVGRSSLDASKLAVSGEIIDVTSGASFATFKAEGSPNDLFRIEDAVLGQVRQVVAGLVGASATAGREQPPAAPSTSGSRYPGSDLARSLETTNLRGLEIANSASSKYNQQPYHLVEEPDINFLLPYYGGYGYGPDYGWPYYTYYNPWFPYYGGGWSWGDGGLVIINNSNIGNSNTPTTPAMPGNSGGNNGGNTGGNNGGNNGSNNPNGTPSNGTGGGFRDARAIAGGGLDRNSGRVGGLATQQPQVRPSTAAPRPTPGPSSGNTMQYSPGYEIRPVERQPVRR